MMRFVIAVALCVLIFEGARITVPPCDGGFWSGFRMAMGDRCGR